MAEKLKRNELSIKQLGQRVEEATYHLSCWMTVAQREKARNQKVIFQDFE